MNHSEGRARRIARNTAVLYGSEFLSRLFTWGLTAYLARAWADVSVYGQYALLVNWVTLAVVVGDLGLNVVVVREVARKRELAEFYLSHSIVLRAAAGVVLWALLEVAAVLLGYESTLRWGLLAMGARIVFDGLAGGYIYLLQAHERMPSVALVNVAASAIRFAGIAVMIMFGGSVIAASWVWSLASLLSFLALLMIGRTHGWRLKLSDLRLAESMRLLRTAIPLAAFGALQMLYYRVDAVMLKSMVGDEAVGFYDLASKVLFVVLVFAQLYSNALFPTMSALQDDRPAFGAFVLRTGKVQLLLAVPMAVGGYFLATPLMLLMGGGKYEAAGPLFAVLALSIVPFFLATIYTDVLAIKSPRRLNALFLGLLALNVVLNLVFIPKWGGPGAAWATVVSEYVGVPLGFGLAYPWLREARGVSVVRPVLASLAAAGLMGLGLWWRPVLGWIIVGPVVYALGLWLFRALDATEVRQLRQLLRRNRKVSDEVTEGVRV
jgi:O-antigen/teichoic acid export membrane protein